MNITFVSKPREKKSVEPMEGSVEPMGESVESIWGRVRVRGYQILFAPLKKFSENQFR